MPTIEFLADHPELVHLLADWFKAQWPEYYANDTHEDVEQQFLQEMNRDRIPIRLVAFVEQQLAGCIVLRQFVIASDPAYSPGLGGLFMHSAYRMQGIGTQLVSAGMQLATDLGYPVIYATTISARGILEQLGWQLIKMVNQHGEALGLYRYITGIS
jgi:RimJ/RimL family protein N-acetyltransferase